MDNLAPPEAVNQDPNGSSQHDQHTSPLQYPLPQRQQIRYHQQQHEYVDQDPSSSTLFMQAWLRPAYDDGHQEHAFYDPNMHASSLLANDDGHLALSTNDNHQHLGNNNLAPGSPSSISTCLSELSNTAAFHGAHISSPATTTNIDNTTEEPTTSHTSTTTTIETSSAPVSQIEDWKQRAHQAIWATNLYQRKKRRGRSSGSRQEADDNETTTSSHHGDDDNYDEASSLQSSSSSQPTAAKKRRVAKGYSITCEQCNIHFTRDRDLRRHNLSKHVRKRYVCDHCSNSFTRNDSKSHPPLPPSPIVR
ncbi:hypothetical protein O0I10_009139 [Lichtheimia ornata]|uniref:C2H2-type domain-containing protein n=1 Tax=Lichtheimia ornata TaxID=688661 RepID=A0AAD7V025_9FUNG|nr:uncharacterized protein O0I10_009139 [Lichtheimia ornata]KAJ8655271.1 hypothetical protein O0I10_009139 [Lichtheimia ornata]